MIVKKLDMRRRFAFIETRVNWGDGCTAGELGEAFGISRQAAQAVIQEYNRLYPGNLVLSRSQRRHVATADFSPAFIKTEVNVFLDYLRGQSAISHYLEGDDWSEIPFVDGDRLIRPKIPNSQVKQVLEALYCQKTVQVLYQSKNRLIWRVMSPHHLVFIDNRYHFRAYCFMAKAFRDFSLARIQRAEADQSEDWISERMDEEWNDYELLIFEPLPDTPPDRLLAMQAGYDMLAGQLRVRCRMAISIYVIRKLADQGWMLQERSRAADSPVIAHTDHQEP